MRREPPGTVEGSSMFNFIAGGLLNYLLVNHMRPPGSMDPSTARFPEATHLPTLHDVLGVFGIEFSRAAPANISFLIAILACVFVWAPIWRTRFGYELRAYGHSEPAAVYAGISPKRIVVWAMLTGWPPRICRLYSSALVFGAERMNLSRSTSLWVAASPLA